MKNVVVGLAVAGLVLAGTTFASAFTDDFSGPGETVGSASPNFTTQPINNDPTNGPWNSADNWQIVQTSTGETAYQCVDAQYNALDRGFATVSGLDIADFHMSADVYDASKEFGIFGRGTAYEDCLDCTGFEVNEFYPDGNGGISFFRFGFAGGDENWSNLGFTQWAPTGAFPHGAGNRIHLDLTVVGATWTGSAFAYDSTGSLVATANTTYTFTTPQATHGLVGISTYSESAKFDNVTVESVPEPGSLAALSMGLGLAFTALKRRRK